ncbi:MAG TPA: hypothetical protein VG458_05530 [Solirubrobacterales bacterium]|nr:hypothetical protein [Solirubrobacterales bacterium]
MPPPKYVDLLLLAAGLVVFLLGDFPMLGYAVGAAVWIIQRVVQEIATRRATRELAAGNRQRAMGIVAATTLGRVWLMATTVLVVGLTAEKQDGLAAAVMVLVFFTVTFVIQGLSHLFGHEPEGQGAA